MKRKEETCGGLSNWDMHILIKNKLVLGGLEQNGRLGWMMISTLYNNENLCYVYWVLREHAECGCKIIINR